MPAKVTITKDYRIQCSGCGRKVKAEYKAQDPAPCGCAWVWEGDRLIAVLRWKKEVFESIDWIPKPDR